MQNNLLQEAIHIGDQLMHTAESTPHGTTWKTRGTDENGKVIAKSVEDIYTGVSGIVLFLLALYKETKNTKYMRVSEKAMQWVDWYCRQHPTNHYAFYSGRMGVSFTFLKLYEATNNKKYLRKALATAKKSLIFLEEPHKVHDLLNGTSGALLVLLHLHAATKEHWILEYIQKYTDDLLRSAKLDKGGLYWDSDPQEVRPLCGFSHGSSGIGFVFLELGHYLQSPAYYYIAEQAFSYENQFFDSKINNWPLFRIMLYSEKECEVFESFYKKKQFKYFTKYTDKNSWCHGAVGVGLSRLRALELFTNNHYRKDLRNALIKTKNTQYPTFTLCHGMGGNMELFIEQYNATHNKKNKQYIQQIAQNALDQKKKENHYISGFKDGLPTNEELSLFNGASGVGYFLLRASNPGQVFSILLPKLTQSSQYPLPQTHSLMSLKLLLFKNVFPRTTELAEQYAPQKTQQYFQQKNRTHSELLSFLSFIEKLIPTLPPDVQLMLKDYFSLEKTKMHLLENRKSNGLLFIKERLNAKVAKKILKLSDGVLTKQIFSLAPETKLFLINQPKEIAFILKLTPYGVAEIQVNDFCYEVLKQFAKPRSVTKTLDSLNQKYKNTSTKDVIEKNTLVQIREAIEYGILEPPTLDKDL